MKKAISIILIAIVTLSLTACALETNTPLSERTVTPGDVFLGDSSPPVADNLITGGLSTGDRWEYIRKSRNDFDSIDEVMEEANRLGREGWELVSVTDGPVIMYFKRKL